MKLPSIFGAGAVASVLALGMVLGGGASADAVVTSKAAQAEAVFKSVIDSSNPAAAISSLSASDRVLFDEWTTPGPTTMSVQSMSDVEASPATSCGSSYTARAAFYNQVGAKLGTMYTTGSACRSATKVTSVTFVDGGGDTGALGWSYSGKTTGKGIQQNVGYIYGAYTFTLNIAGIQIQKPTYCARVVQTLGAAYGDTTCGIGG